MTREAVTPLYPIFQCANSCIAALPFKKMQEWYLSRNYGFVSYRCSGSRSPTLFAHSCRSFSKQPNVYLQSLHQSQAMHRQQFKDIYVWFRSLVSRTIYLRRRTARARKCIWGCLLIRWPVATKENSLCKTEPTNGTLFK